jgi:hypothetical protein
LSVDEYPDVSVTEDETGAREAWLGASLYEETEGDIITVENAVGFDKTFTITPSYKVEQFSIVVTGNVKDRIGQLLVRSREDATAKFGNWSLIAKLKCK